MPANDPVTFGTDVRVGDLLLMETDPRWTRSAERVQGKLVAVITGDVPAGRRRAVLATVRGGEMPSFGWLEAVSELYSVLLHQAKGDPDPAWLVVPGDRTAAQEAASNLEGEILTLDRVVAVRVNLGRPSW